MRRAARIDENQPAIVKLLHQLGCSVQPLHAVGKGCPDLLVGLLGSNYLIEIKNPAKVPSQRRLTPDQTTWHSAWTGQVAVIETEAEAEAFVRAIRTVHKWAPTLAQIAD